MKDWKKNYLRYKMWFDEYLLSSSRVYLNFPLQNIRFDTIKHGDVITCSKCWKFVTGFTAFFLVCRKWISLLTLEFSNIELLIIRFFFLFLSKELDDCVWMRVHQTVSNGLHYMTFLAEKKKEKQLSKLKNPSSSTTTTDKKIRAKWPRRYLKWF